LPYSRPGTLRNHPQTLRITPSGRRRAAGPRCCGSSTPAAAH